MDSYTQSGEPITDWAFTQSPFAQAIVGTDLRCLGINDRMSAMFGLGNEELRGRLLTEVLHGPQYDAMERFIQHVLDTGEPAHRETFRRVPGESREQAWSVSVCPLKDAAGRTRAVLVGVLNITEQYWARQRLTLLNEAGTHVGTALDITRTAQELVDMVIPRFADMAVVDLLDAVLSGGEPAPGQPSGNLVMRRAAHGSIFAGTPEAVVRPGEISIHPDTFPSARCLAANQAVVTQVDGPTLASWAERDRARTESVAKFGIHSVLSLPIRARGVTLGVAIFFRGQRAEPFEPDDVLLAEELVARAALSLDNARRYTRERTAALALQRSLLPRRLPRQSAVDVASRYLPASAHADVGGDWFDVIPLSGTRVALVVGDVVGHDMRASGTMGRLRTAVRTLADVDLPPAELLMRLDDQVNRISAEVVANTGGEGDRDVAATCLYAVYDPVSRRCNLARAGHPPPALVTPDGAVNFLELPAGPPLGLGGVSLGLSGVPFESAEVELPAGSILALYTDGLIESRDRDIDRGLDRLRQALARKETSLEATCDNVLAAVLPGRPEDDVALLLARTRALRADEVAIWDLPADPVVVASIRQEVATRLAEWGLDETAFVTELVVSELITNAIRYAQSPIQLRVIRDSALICEVSDGSSTAPHLRQARAYDEGGRGLLLVAQLAQRWGSRQTMHGKTIWAELPLPGRNGA